jgi:hypothetical protein
MARKRRPPDDPREWLNRARHNLLRAQNPISDDYLEDYCFDAQQAAEKAIKAIFILHGERFPYIHNLGTLLRLSPEDRPQDSEIRSRGTRLKPICCRVTLSWTFRADYQEGVSTPRPYRRSSLSLGRTADRNAVIRGEGQRP